MQRKSVIFLVISLLAVALVYSPSSTFSIPNRSNEAGATCTPTGNQTPNGGQQVRCCWFESVPVGTGIEGGGLELYCSTCENGGTRGNINCSGPELQYRQVPKGTVPLQGGGVIENPPMLPSGPAPPLQGGVLEQLEQGEGVSPGFSERQQQPPADQGAAELPPPATEETQPATVEEEQPVPVCQEGLEFNEDLGFCVPEDCPEGQVLDEESGICVLEEPEATEEPAQPEPEEEQPSEESNSGDDNNN